MNGDTEAFVRAYATLSEPEQRFLAGIHHNAAAEIAATIRAHGKRPGLGTAIAQARIAFLGAEMAPLFATSTTGRAPIACERGCGWCCTLKIEPTPDEIFALADYIAAELEPDQQAHIKAAALENARRAWGKPDLERHALKLFCPVLDHASHACLAHAARPMACQGYLSLDRNCCEADHHGPPASIPQPLIADMLRDAVTAARAVVCKQAHLDQTQVELTEGLLTVWSDPEAERRWIDGGIFRVAPPDCWR